MARLNVFLSHSSKDKPVVRRINRRLRQCGVETFLDEEELEAADYLPARFSKAIGASSHIVVVWTAAAAASPWVQRELQFARAKMWRKPQIVPLLFVPPGDDPVIKNIKGLDFTDPFEFEAAFAGLLRFVAGRAPADEPVPAADIAAALEETPGARAVLEAKRPEDLAAFALPELGHKNWAGLDYILWAAARNAGQIEAFLTYPGVFAKAFGRTGAGFEALMALGARNDVNEKIFGSLIDSAAIGDAAFDRVITLAERSPYPPMGWAWRFARNTLTRMSPAQRRRMFALVERWGDTPSPGLPADLLGELAAADDMRAEVMAKMTSWLERGLFDGASQTPPRESPHTFHGFVRHLDARGMTNEAERLMEEAYARIRKLFRSASTPSVLTALRWVADGDRLPLNPKPYVRIMERAAQDGVYSSEFEGWQHARAVAPLASALSRALQEPHEQMRQQTMSAARSEVRNGLRVLGLEVPGL
jgi:hypothetical protein